MPAKDYWAYWAEPGFKLLKSFPHKCPNCSETMERVGEDEEIEKAELLCPKCGAKLVVEHTVSWD